MADERGPGRQGSGDGDRCRDTVVGLTSKRVQQSGEFFNIGANADSPFYQSQAFGKMIDYMMKYTRRCDLREQNGRRSMLIKDVTNVETAVSVLQEIVALPVKEQDDH